MSKCAFARLTAAEAASLIDDGQMIGFGGFTTAGAAQSIAAAIGARAAQEQAAGREFAIGNIGVATGSIDAAMADATFFRSPFQCNPRLRARINAGKCDFVDMHISHLTQAVRYGLLGPLDWAIVQAADVSPDGRLLLTSAVGGAPTFCRKAKKVLIELNRYHPPDLLGMHDIYEPKDPQTGARLAFITSRTVLGVRSSRLIRRRLWASSKAKFRTMARDSWSLID